LRFRFGKEKLGVRFRFLGFLKTCMSVELLD
jgi:hypothetical protein